MQQAPQQKHSKLDSSCRAYPVHGLLDVLVREVLLLQVSGDGAADLGPQIVHRPQPSLQQHGGRDS